MVTGVEMKWNSKGEEVNGRRIKGIGGMNMDWVSFAFKYMRILSMDRLGNRKLNS